jgi:hypothetical protein
MANHKDRDNPFYQSKRFSDHAHLFNSHYLQE